MKLIYELRLGSMRRVAQIVKDRQEPIGPIIHEFLRDKVVMRMIVAVSLTLSCAELRIEYGSA